MWSLVDNDVEARTRFIAKLQAEESGTRPHVVVQQILLLCCCLRSAPGPMTTLLSTEPTAWPWHFLLQSSTRPGRGASGNLPHIQWLLQEARDDSTRWQATDPNAPPPPQPHLATIISIFNCEARRRHTLPLDGRLRCTGLRAVEAKTAMSNYRRLGDDLHGLFHRLFALPERDRRARCPDQLLEAAAAVLFGETDPASYFASARLYMMHPPPTLPRLGPTPSQQSSPSVATIEPTSRTGSAGPEEPPPETHARSTSSRRLGGKKDKQSGASTKRSRGGKAAGRNQRNSARTEKADQRGKLIDGGRCDDSSPSRSSARTPLGGSDDDDSDDNNDGDDDDDDGRNRHDGGDDDSKAGSRSMAAVEMHVEHQGGHGRSSGDSGESDSIRVLNARAERVRHRERYVFKLWTETLYLFEQLLNDVAVIRPLPGSAEVSDASVVRALPDEIIHQYRGKLKKQKTQREQLGGCLTPQPFSQSSESNDSNGSSQLTGSPPSQPAGQRSGPGEPSQANLAQPARSGPFEIGQHDPSGPAAAAAPSSASSHTLSDWKLPDRLSQIIPSSQASQSMQLSEPDGISSGQLVESRPPTPPSPPKPAYRQPFRPPAASTASAARPMTVATFNVASGTGKRSLGIHRVATSFL